MMRDVLDYHRRFVTIVVDLYISDLGARCRKDRHGLRRRRSAHPGGWECCFKGRHEDLANHPIVPAPHVGCSGALGATFTTDVRENNVVIVVEHKVSHFVHSHLCVRAQ